MYAYFIHDTILNILYYTIHTIYMCIQGGLPPTDRPNPPGAQSGPVPL